MLLYFRKRLLYSLRKGFREKRFPLAYAFVEAFRCSSLQSMALSGE